MARNLMEMPLHYVFIYIKDIKYKNFVSLLLLSSLLIHSRAILRHNYAVFNKIIEFMCFSFQSFYFKQQKIISSATRNAYLLKIDYHYFLRNIIHTCADFKVII